MPRCTPPTRRGASTPSTRRRLWRPRRRSSRSPGFRAGDADPLDHAAHDLDGQRRIPGRGLRAADVYAVILAAFLACCLWLVLAPPRALTTSRLARRTGLATAVLLGVCFVWAARSGDVMATFVFLPPVAISFLGSAVAAAVRRSFRAGVQTTVWTTLTGTLLVFSCWLVEAVRLYRAEGALLLDGETLYPVGANVTDAVFWVLVFVPAWGLLPFGVMGAAVGSRLPRLLRPARRCPWPLKPAR
ncbi:hypothetical protein [Streptomyces sp. NPDC051738]|uniref:hypothetical protein n=1 Tax=Streptomyces sp. NPDC051738 TaxID=3365672 RepID=UPI0037D7E564